MSESWIGTAVEFIVLGVGIVTSYVKLEGKTDQNSRDLESVKLQNAKDIESLRIQHERDLELIRVRAKEREASDSKAEERTIKMIEGMNGTMQGLTIQVARMMERLDHTNKKVLDLTANGLKNLFEGRMDD